MYNRGENKRDRTLQRLLSIYFWPASLAVLLGTSVYLGTKQFNLDRTDTGIGCGISIFIGYLIHLRNRLKWVRLPDGSYINIPIDNKNTESGKIDQSHPVAEPSHYSISFYISTSSKVLTIVCGIFLIGLAVFFASRTSIILPLLLTAAGIYMTQSGIKDLMDKSLELKLAKEGLWTKVLGFQTWDLVDKVEITIETGSRSSSHYLEIYLKNNEIGFPNQRLQLDNIENKDRIKSIIDDLLSKSKRAHQS